jgi:methionyl-tRNA synthetase
MITIEDFKNIQIKTGRIIKAEKIENSSKLVRLMVDLNEAEPRQIIAGIGKKYKPENLEGKEIVVVVNLEPKEIKGFKSEGMLLAAVDEMGDPVILIPEGDVPPGAEVR